MTVFTRKFSEFVPENVDEVVGLTAGANAIGPNSGGGGGGSVIAIITQVPGGPILALGQWVRINVQGVDVPVGAYVPALATDAHLGERVGVIVQIGPLSNQYGVQQCGYIKDTSTLFPALTTGSPYFLDTVVPGNMVITDVNAVGEDSVPCFIPDTATSGWVVPYRGIIINGSAPSSGGGGGGTDSNIHIINQPGNTFSVGNWVRVSGNTIYSLADATTLANAQSVGVVISSGNPNFTVQFAGWNASAVTTAVDAIGNPTPIVSAGVYYLSSVSPGNITLTVPDNAISKPVFISESSTSMTGWILPQRPLPYFATNPGISPLVFLGRLDSSNNFSSTTILQDSNGNTFNMYHLYIENGAFPTGGINASGAGNITMGLQLYAAGSFSLTNYNYFLSGIFSAAGSNIANNWAQVKDDNLAESLVIFPSVAHKESLTSGLLILNNLHGSYLMTMNVYEQDVTPAPIVGYTCHGTSGSNIGGGAATGLRVWASAGGVLDITSGGYISVYGVPNS